MIVKELVAMLGFQVDQASADKASGGIEKIIDLAKKAAVVFAGLKIVDTFKGWSVEVANVGDKFDKMALRTGMSSQELQKWAHAAELSGASIESLEGSTRKLSMSMGMAADGNKEAIDGFKKLGINIRDADGSMKSVDQLLPELADGFANMSNDTERTETAMRILGKQGTMLLPLLRQGSAAVEDQRKEFEELGGVIDDDLKKASTEYLDNQTRIKAGMMGLKNIVAKALLPAMVKMQEKTIAWVKANREWIAQKVGPILKDIATAILRIRELFGDVVDGIVDWVKGMDPVGQKVLKITGIVLALLAVLALPLGPILAIGAAIMMVLEDFQVWRSGGVSVIGTLIDQFKKLLSAFPALRAALKVVGGYFTGVFMAMRDTVFAFLKFFVDWWEVGFGGAFKRLGKSLGQVFADIWDRIGEHIKAAGAMWWDLITGFFTMLWGWIKAIVGAIVDVIVWPFKMAWWAVLEGAKALWNGLVAICTAIGAAFSAVWDAIVAGAKSAWGFLVSLVMERVNNMIANFTWFGQAVMGVLTTLWSGITAGFNWVWDSLVTMVKFYVDLILAPFRGMMALWNALWTDGLDGVLALLKSWAQVAIDSVLAPFRKVKEWIGKLFGGGKAAELEVGITRTEKTAAGAPGAQAPGAPFTPMRPAPFPPINERTILMARGMANVAQAGPVAFAPPSVQMTPARGPVTIAPQTKVEVQVNATPGMDEAKLAQQVAKQVENAIESQNRLAIQALTPAAAAAR